MRRGRRALVESLALHGLLVVAMLIMATALTPPPPTIRLDLSLAPPAPAPQPIAAQQEPSVAAVPAPSETAPTPPTQQPEPSALPQKLAPTTAKVKHAIRPAIPAPQPTLEQTQAQVTNTPASTQATSAAVAAAADTSVAKAPAIPADEAYRQANFTAIRNSILANLSYPNLARRRGWSGQIEVAITITPDGRISNLKIQNSSGFPLLDEQALTAIERSAPFSPPPGRTATLVMPINFRLN